LEFDLGLLKLWKSLKIDSNLWLILAALAVLIAWLGRKQWLPWLH